MAMIDYGAIAFKNGKLMNTDMFTNMKECVGWDDTYKEYGDKSALNGNYFVYIGDKDATIGFYKEMICIYKPYINIDAEPYLHHEFFNNNYTWSKWEDYIGGEKCTVTHRNGYYVLKWKYKGDKYKVYFGYGVDIGSYMKWHIVNYYKSLPCWWSDLKHKMKHGW